MMDMLKTNNTEEHIIIWPFRCNCYVKDILLLHIEIHLMKMQHLFAHAKEKPRIQHKQKNWC